MAAANIDSLRLRDDWPFRLQDDWPCHLQTSIGHIRKLSMRSDSGCAIALGPRAIATCREGVAACGEGTRRTCVCHPHSSSGPEYTNRKMVPFLPSV